MTRKPKNRVLSPDAPLKHNDHPHPRTRREFIKQGFMTGTASVLGGGVFSLFANPNEAMAAVSDDLQALVDSMPNCTLGGLTGDAKVPFICFDLAGGANIAGSNVLVGQGAGQLDNVSTGGFSKMGVPGDMVPGLDSANFTLRNPSINNDFVNDELNLLFHADSAMLLGIREKAGGALGFVDGCVIPARSDNDTGNNPHNPLYGISLAGGTGDVVDLIGSRNSDSGGNSMSPAALINPEVRPTKVDRSSDVTGLVDIGNLNGILSDPADVTAVFESIARLTHKKLQVGDVTTGLTNDAVVKDLMRCGYIKASDIANRFAGQDSVAPKDDPLIVPSIFSEADLLNDNEFDKTASIMKLVMNGHSAGGCITMGGYDYHTGDRRTGENRDLRAGRCIGACLNYAQQLGKPLLIYVFSDGSVFSNGAPDDTDDNGGNLGGKGKGNWTGDNSSTACSFMLAFKPSGVISLQRQIGRFSADASVVTSASPAANNPNLLVNMVVLNYMAANGQSVSDFESLYSTNGLSHGLGSGLDSYIAFDKLVP